MSVVLTVILVVIAAVATYFVARASKAILEIRREVLATRALVDSEAEAIAEQVQALRKQAKEVLSIANKTCMQSKRVLDRVYGQQKDIDQVMNEPRIQDALRKIRRGP